MPAQLGAEKQHPADWEPQSGFLVVDPIGWRRRGIEWDRPITWDAFVLMSQDSGLRVVNPELAADTGVVVLPEFEDKVISAADPIAISGFDQLASPTFDQLLTGQFLIDPNNEGRPE